MSLYVYPPHPTHTSCAQDDDSDTDTVGLVVGDLGQAPGHGAATGTSTGVVEASGAVGARRTSIIPLTRDAIWASFQTASVGSTAVHGHSLATGAPGLEPPALPESSL
jgi:hypothetical protein